MVEQCISCKKSISSFDEQCIYCRTLQFPLTIVVELEEGGIDERDEDGTIEYVFKRRRAA